MSYAPTVQTGPKTSSHETLSSGRGVRDHRRPDQLARRAIAAGEDLGARRPRLLDPLEDALARAARRSAGRRRSPRRPGRRRRAPRPWAGTRETARRRRRAGRRSAARRCSSGRRRRRRSRRARVAASSRSASASTITGVAFPSSSLTRLRGARSRELPADLARAGERDRAHALVLDEHVADLGRRPDEDVQPARRQPRLRLELGEQQRRERRLRGRLEHDRAAGRERRRDLVRDEVEREVERRDRADDADRPPQRERELARARLRGVHRHHLAGELARLDGGESCTSTSRGTPRRGRPSAACRPRPQIVCATSSWRRPRQPATRTRISARLCAGSGSRIASSAASIARRARGRRPSRPADELAGVGRAHLDPLAGLDPLAAESSFCSASRCGHAVAYAPCVMLAELRWPVRDARGEATSRWTNAPHVDRALADGRSAGHGVARLGASSSSAGVRSALLREPSSPTRPSSAAIGARRALSRHCGGRADPPVPA